MIWNPSEGIDLGFFVIRFYSLAWVFAFAIGWFVMKPIFVRENQSVENLDKLFVYTLIATMLGARLGHVIFYQSELFYQDPLSILLPISTKPSLHFTGFAGLASHGAAISIIIMVYYFCKKIIYKPILWLLDRIVIPVASGAVFIRLGNFINSEIIGKPTDASSFMAMKFIKGEDLLTPNVAMQQTQIGDANEAYTAIATNPKFSAILESIPYRYPAQLYEAILYVFVFGILLYMYWKTDARNKQGFLFGTFLVLLWTVRFVVEYVKESQGGIEESLGLFSTGQWLSIPFVLAGLYFMYRANTRKTASI